MQEGCRHQATWSESRIHDVLSHACRPEQKTCLSQADVHGLNVISRWSLLLNRAQGLHHFFAGSERAFHSLKMDALLPRSGYPQKLSILILLRKLSWFPSGHCLWWIYMLLFCVLIKLYLTNEFHGMLGREFLSPIRSNEETLEHLVAPPLYEVCAHSNDASMFKRWFHVLSFILSNISFQLCFLFVLHYIHFTAGKRDSGFF